MDNIVVKIIIGIIIVFFIAKTCGREKTSTPTVAETWQKSPVDQLIKELNGEQNYSIILFDMDADDNNTYRHQYQVIIEKADTVLESKTDWKNVSQAFFSQNLNNMGMEIVSKKDGVLTKQAVPAGYNHYVGNEKYGRWDNRGGSSFWAFYGQYAFMSSMFHMMTYRRSYWDDYRRGGYYGSSRGYYGPHGGAPVYGTQAYTSTSAGKNSKWGSKPSTFKDKVRSRVSRSTASSKTRTSARTKRSSSRYRTSSTRSRSGGFGK